MKFDLSHIERYYIDRNDGNGTYEPADKVEIWITPDEVQGILSLLHEERSITFDRTDVLNPLCQRNAWILRAWLQSSGTPHVEHRLLGATTFMLTEPAP